MMGATRKRMIEENSLRNMIDDNQASICEITLRGVCIHINIQEEFSFLKLSPIVKIMRTPCYRRNAPAICK
jgi:hypothetical protein